MLNKERPSSGGLPYSMMVLFHKMDCESAEQLPLNYHTVTLDRPFIYAIIDDATGLPIFIGTVTNID